MGGITTVDVPLTIGCALSEQNRGQQKESEDC
jgi:hypothetical protein